MRVYYSPLCPVCTEYIRRIKSLEPELVDIETDPEAALSANIVAIPTTKVGHHFKVGNPDIKELTEWHIQIM